MWIIQFILRFIASICVAFVGTGADKQVILEFIANFRKNTISDGGYYMFILELNTLTRQLFLMGLGNAGCSHLQ